MRDIDQLAAGVCRREPRALARVLSLIESAHPDARAIVRAVRAAPDGVDRLSEPHRCHVIGVTGAPGVGKSTLTSALVGALRERGSHVAVLAVDPTSPFYGGALLGDRIRMSAHAVDPGVFIRSMAARGHLGGLAAAVPPAIRLLEVAGFDVVLIETVGVGQSEVDIAARADTCLVLLAPGMGDGIQAAKAGVLEIADVFVVNKADRDGARATVSDVRALVRLAARSRGAWRPPVVSCSAHLGTGIEELLTAIDDHARWGIRDGAWERRREARAASEVEALVLARLRGWIVTQVDRSARMLGNGAGDPQELADQITATLIGPRERAGVSDPDPVG